MANSIIGANNPSLGADVVRIISLLDNNVLNGTAADEALYGDANNNTLNGGLGDDVIISCGGTNALYGGGGSDLFVLSPLIDGTDTIHDFGVDDYLYFDGVDSSGYTPTQNGNDLQLVVGNYTLILKNVSLNDIDYDPILTFIDEDGDVPFIQGDDTDEVIEGTGANDEFEPEGGDDTINGYRGDDLFIGGWGNNVMTGGAGADIFEIMPTFTDKDVITDFDLTKDLLYIEGYVFSDFTITNNATGNAVLAIDPYYTITLQGVTASDITAALFTNDDDGDAGDEDEQGDNPINDDRSGLSTDESLIGGNNDDVLVGGSGNDYFESRQGDDLLTGNAGNDNFLIWATLDDADVITDFDVANDTLQLRYYSSEVTTQEINAGADLQLSFTPTQQTLILTGVTQAQFNGAANIQYLADGSARHSISWYEDVDFQLTSSNNDTVAGDGGDDYIITVGGKDLIDAGAGNDTVYAGSGDDYVYAHARYDLIYGEAGDDTLISGHGTDTLSGGSDNDLFHQQ